jgi:L-amino acid N-acyltransferase YncA
MIKFGGNMNYEIGLDKDSGYVIRDFENDDLQAIVDLVNCYSNINYEIVVDESFLSPFRDRMIVSCVLEYKKIIVGFSMIMHSEFYRTIAIENVWILSEHTGKGFGKLLIDINHRKSLEMGVNSVIAKTISFNDRAIAFFLKNDYKQIGSIKKVSGNYDQVFMQYMVGQ